MDCDIFFLGTPGLASCLAHSEGLELLLMTSNGLALPLHELHSVDPTRAREP